MPLTEAEEIELLRLTEQEYAYRQHNRLFDLYPDRGPLRRELYPKHLSFFAAGAIHNERAIIAANRCLTLNTAIETDRGERLLGEVACETGFGVRSLVDGSLETRPASPVFLKGIEPAFRLLLDNGQAIECSGRHRVLTVEGWVSVARLLREAFGYCGDGAFYPFQHVGLVGGQRVVEVQSIGLQQIVDFEVPGPHNYRAGGVIHHNSGKSMAVCYELTCHMLGFYPPWWEGRRFRRPVMAWVAGEDSKSVRESLQVILFGPPEAPGTGLIPKDAIASTTARGGVPEAIDTATIKSRWGGVSRMTLKFYEQGREAFQAAKIDVMVFDEEPPMSVYTEGLTRTLSTTPGERSGLVMCAFTPISGLSGLVLAYMPGGSRVEGALT